jgi:hypothetical protein
LAEDPRRDFDELLVAAQHAVLANNPFVQPGTTDGPCRLESLIDVGGMVEV